MPFPFYSLRTGILAVLLFLILAAMVLTNVVMIKFAERDLVDRRVQMGRDLIRLISRKFQSLPTDGQLRLGVPESGLRKEIVQLARIAGYSGVLVTNTSGATVFSVGSCGNVEGTKPPLGLTGKDQEGNFELTGRIWGVILPAPGMVRIFSPLLSQGRPVGTLTLCSDLAPCIRT